jgi:tetratricopeptide (TPR) repeat protein
MDEELENEVARAWNEQQPLAGNLPATEQACLSRLESAPDDSSVWQQLAMLRFRSGRLSDAEAALRSAIAVAARSTDAWALLGLVLLQQRRWAEAITAYQRALELSPNDAGLWSNLGIAHWKLGELVAADEAYQRSLENSKDDLPTITNYARLLLDRRQPEKSRVRAADDCSSTPNARGSFATRRTS